MAFDSVGFQITRQFVDLCSFSLLSSWKIHGLRLPRTSSFPNNNNNNNNENNGDPLATSHFILPMKYCICIDERWEGINQAILIKFCWWLSHSSRSIATRISAIKWPPKPPEAWWAPGTLSTFGIGKSLKDPISPRECPSNTRPCPINPKKSGQELIRPRILTRLVSLWVRQLMQGLEDVSRWHPQRWTRFRRSFGKKLMIFLRSRESLTIVTYAFILHLDTC